MHFVTFWNWTKFGQKQHQDVIVTVIAMPYCMALSMENTDDCDVGGDKITWSVIDLKFTFNETKNDLRYQNSTKGSGKKRTTYTAYLTFQLLLCSVSCMSVKHCIMLSLQLFR